MSGNQPHYLSYLLRVWRVKRNPHVKWLASLESPTTGERKSFSDLGSLFAFIMAQTQPSREGADADSSAPGDDVSGVG